MCAGIQFPLDKIDPRELDRFVLPDDFEGHRKGDSFQAFFWDKQPFLPVEEADGVHLYPWGNRDALLKMPKTGWTKVESLQDGKWDYLMPKKVLIPCEFGYEKKKWFRTPVGLTGIKTRYHNVIRVYLLTEKADQNFINFTGHDRMPVSWSAI